MAKTYETAIKIGAAIAKAFKSDTYSAATALGKLTEATKRMREAEKASASYKRLNDTIATSRTRYNQATDALRRLEAAEKAAGGATKESTKWRKAGEREVAAAARELDRATKAAQKNSSALQKLGIDAAKTAADHDRLARAIAATERQEKALTAFQSSRARVFGEGKSKTPLSQKAGEQIGGLARDAALLGTAAVGAGAALSALVMKSLRMGDEIGDTADKLGISAKALQELRYGASQSGAEVGSLDKGLAKMAVTIGKFKSAKGTDAGVGGIAGLQMLGTGGKAGDKDPFKQLGLNAKTLATLKPEEQLKKIADAMLKLKTHDDRAAVAQAIFGKGATQLLPYLAEGSVGIDKMSKAANRFGGVMSKDAIAAADEADKALKDAELAVAGLTASLGSAFLPVATKVFRQFAGWVASNRGEIQKWATTAAAWIEGKAIPAVLKIGGEFASLAGKALYMLEAGAKLTGGFGNLAIAIGALRLAPLAVTMSKIGFETGKAALSLYRYAAASNAAKAAGGIPGVAPASALTAAGKAIGLAANAALIVGAAAIGYEIGKALDEWIGLSDWFGKLARKDEDERDEEFTKANARRRLNLRHNVTDPLSELGVPRTGGGDSVQYAPTFQIVGGENLQSVERQLDESHEKSKKKVLDHLRGPGGGGGGRLSFDH